MSSGLIQVFVELGNLDGSTLRRNLFRVKPPTAFNMIKNFVYSIPCSCGKIYKGERGRPQKVRLEEYQKLVVRGDIEKKKAGGHFDQNVVEITIKMQAIVRKPLMI